MTVNVQIKNIGPDQASALLAGNISNRDLSQSFVNKYAADMSDYQRQKREIVEKKYNKNGFK